MSEGREIERKFLTASEAWRDVAADPVAISQGYLSRNPERTVRVRRKGEKGYLTIKAGLSPLDRLEYEYEIPMADAERLLEICAPPLIRKVRSHWRAPDGLLWEIDEFSEPRPGLVLVEVELAHAEQPYAAPAWLGREVTDDPAYTNAAMGRT